MKYYVWRGKEMTRRAAGEGVPDAGLPALFVWTAVSGLLLYIGFSALLLLACISGQ